MSRRTSAPFGALIVGLALLFVAAPALASLIIGSRMSADIDLVAGPRFYAYGSGTSISIGESTAWSDFTFEGLTIGPDGAVTLDREGKADPSAAAWWDTAWRSRACVTIPAAPPSEPPSADPRLTVLTLDSTAEIEAARLAPDLSDLRIIDVATGLPVPHRVDGPIPSSSTRVLAEMDPAETELCAYWENPGATRAEDDTLANPVVADGNWTWERWATTGDGLSLDLVDWNTPSASSPLSNASSPVDVCDRCATELLGYVVAPTTDAYTFAISAAAVGTLEIAPAADPAGLALIVTLDSATTLDQFDDPAQRSTPIDLVAGESYVIRARAKSLTGAEHLQVAWSVADGPATVIPTEALRDADGTAGQISYRRFDVVPTIDVSTPPTDIFTVTASEITADSCDVCQHRIGGYVLVEEAGTYRFHLSSDDEGTLWLAPDGDPANASIRAWTAAFTNPDTWDTFASQRSTTVELSAGQVIWIEATNRDAGGPGHLQVGWSLETGETDPATGDPVPATVSLLPPGQLSSNPPAPAELAAFAVGATEGLFAGAGTFVSPALDTDDVGSNVHGLVDQVIASTPTDTDVTLQLSFAPTPEGPWEPVGPERDPSGSFTTGDPVPLTFDGLRYVRFAGELTTLDPETAPALSELSIEHDLVEVGAVDSSSSLAVNGIGDHELLRIRGGVGPGGSVTVEILSGGTLSGLSAATWVEPGRTNQVVVDNGTVIQGAGPAVSFGPEDPQHVGITVSAVGSDSGATNPATLNVRWVGASAGGAVVTHDIVLTIAS